MSGRNAGPRAEATGMRMRGLVLAVTMLVPSLAAAHAPAASVTVRARVLPGDFYPYATLEVFRQLRSDGGHDTMVSVAATGAGSEGGCADTFAIGIEDFIDAGSFLVLRTTSAACGDILLIWDSALPLPATSAFARAVLDPAGPTLEAGGGVTLRTETPAYVYGAIGRQAVANFGDVWRFVEAQS